MAAGRYGHRTLLVDGEGWAGLCLQSRGGTDTDLRQDGELQEEHRSALDTGHSAERWQVDPSGGSAVALDFSHDPNQRFIFLINQNNEQVEIIDRQSGKILSSFGRPGSFPGQFNQAHGIAVDSKDNVYIAENRGRRVHKFKVVNP
ncbi:MAG: hypothetical protein DMG15_06875 [Acidobacteria bacterium]|nr:MAG: hypothetical protein DMG15_06875 [Acidobacteriota bacterium]